MALEHLLSKEATMTAQQIDMLQVQSFFSQLSAPSQKASSREDDIIRVAASSRPHKVAASIAARLRQKGQAEVQAIGMDAINQMIKAIVIARSYLDRDKLDLVMVPSFVDVLIEGESRTALRLSVRACDYPCYPDTDATFV
jgi:stage V sporulation protein S